MEVCVVNCRFVKPIDEKLLVSLRKRFGILVTLEENALKGGFGEEINDTLSRIGFGGGAIHHLGIPDIFIEHGSRKELLDEIGLSPAKISAFVKKIMAKSILQADSRSMIEDHKQA